MNLEEKIATICGENNYRSFTDGIDSDFTNALVALDDETKSSICPILCDLAIKPSGYTVGLRAEIIKFLARKKPKYGIKAVLFGLKSNNSLLVNSALIGFEMLPNSYQKKLESDVLYNTGNLTRNSNNAVGALQLYKMADYLLDRKQVKEKTFLRLITQTNWGDNPFVQPPADAFKDVSTVGNCISLFRVKSREEVNLVLSGFLARRDYDSVIDYVLIKGKELKRANIIPVNTPGELESEADLMHYDVTNLSASHLYKLVKIINTSRFERLHVAEGRHLKPDPA